MKKIKISYNLTENSNLKNINFDNLSFGKSYSDHVFETNFQNGKWEAPRITPYSTLNLKPGAAVLHYAQSVFEGLKAYKNIDNEIVVFRPEKNFKRLNISAERLCIPAYDEELSLAGLDELLRVDKKWIPSQQGCALYIRPFLFASEEFIGVRPSLKYKYLMITSPVGNFFSKPVKLKVEQQYTRAANGGTGFAKAAGNYASSLYAAKLAQQEGYDQVIWTDGQYHKYIEEAGVMNIFFVIDNKLITSALSDTILGGITRDSILTLAKDWGIKVEERKIEIDEVIEAIRTQKLQEAFGSGTAAVVTHIETIGHKGKDYALPNSSSSRELSLKLLKTLEDIKMGRIEDKFKWIHKVKN